MRHALLLSAALAAAIPARAQQTAPPQGPLDDTDWVFVDPSTVRETGGGFGEPERVRMIEKLRERVLDQLCRNIKLKVDYSMGAGEYAGFGLGVKRHLAQMPEGNLAVVDEQSLRLSVGNDFPITEENGVGGSLYLGGRIEGSAMIIRPLEERSSCKELDRLVDVRDIKTIIPLKAERLAEMKLGELWRVPVSATVGYGAALGKILQGDGVQGLSASISFKAEESGTANMTLFRVSDSQLRMRYRVDRVEVHTKGVQVAYTYPAVQFAGFGLGVLGELVKNELTDELRRYAMLSMGWAQAKSDGKRVILEYNIDPRDPVHAAAAIKALKGDFADLVRVGYRLAAQKATDESTRQYYLKLQSDHDAALGPATYAAMSEYEGVTKTTRFSIGLFGGTWSKTRDKDRMTRLNGELEQYMLSHAGKVSAQDFLDLPFLGAVAKEDRRREVYGLTSRPNGGVAGEPMAVFMQQYGFLRATPSSVRETVDGFNDILDLAGALRPGTQRNMKLPADKFDVPAPRPNPQMGRGQSKDLPEAGDRKGIVSFTLVFTQKAVRDILEAPPETAALAFQTVARGAMSNRSLAKATQAFVDELRAIAATADNEQKAESLTRLLVGGGDIKLEYEEVAKVLVQLVDPLDLRGEFVSRYDCPKKVGADVNLRLALRKDRERDLLLDSASAAKNRFATPSILLD